MLDPRVSLAMTMHANPGVYALLLGSGISSSANIPTGWAVIEDIIRKLACVTGKDCESDPAAWFKAKFGQEPTYGQLLERVGNSRAERSSLLKKYFEPNDEERERGEKQPTPAHKAIAQLAKSQVVRVILTTNFDRLMERALESEGVSPIVISTPDGIEGAPPLVHSPCTLIKLHGDYLDLQTKNTPAELSVYDERINSLLDRIFDEYGLIICGWSGDWDEALRNAIERRKNRRYSTWWTCKDQPSEKAKTLIELCQAEMIHIQGADEFFKDIAGKILALEQFNRPHPLSIKMAVSQTKHYLSEPKYHIPLHDLLMGEINRIIEAITDEKYAIHRQLCDRDYVKLVMDLSSLTETAVYIQATGCYWDIEQVYMPTWSHAITVMSNASLYSSNFSSMTSIKMHPAQLLLYAAGIAYTARNNLAAVKSLFTALTTNQNDVHDRFPNKICDSTKNLSYIISLIPGHNNRYLSTFPVSSYLHEVLYPMFHEILLDADVYSSAFDLFEILLTFLCHDDNLDHPGDYTRFMDHPNSFWRCFVRNIQEKKENSDFLQAGFCNGDLKSFEDAVKHIETRESQKI